MSRIAIAVAVSSLFFTAAAAPATPIRVPVDQANSSVTVQLCIAGRCDDDTSPVAGEFWIKLSPVSSPATITLYDFTFALTETLDFYISWGFLGNFTATATNVTMFYATPGTPQPPATVTGGAFTYANVPTNSTGIVNYTATDFPCWALQAAGKPCSDVMNLADQGTQTGTMSGTITVSPARLATLVFNPNVSGPLDPNNPSLGTLTTTGTIRGQVTVPRRGDANLDGVINGNDVQPFLNVLLNPGAYSWQQRFVVDLNDDDVFNLADVTQFVACLVAGGCPD
jgi:hypothetical protein